MFPKRALAIHELGRKVTGHIRGNEGSQMFRWASIVRKAEGIINHFYSVINTKTAKQPTALTYS